MRNFIFHIPVIGLFLLCSSYRAANSLPNDYVYWVNHDPESFGATQLSHSEINAREVKIAPDTNESGSKLTLDASADSKVNIEENVKAATATEVLSETESQSFAEKEVKTVSLDEPKPSSLSKRANSNCEDSEYWKNILCALIRCFNNILKNVPNAKPSDSANVEQSLPVIHPEDLSTNNGPAPPVENLKSSDASIADTAQSNFKQITDVVNVPSEVQAASPWEVNYERIGEKPSGQCIHLIICPKCKSPTTPQQ